MVIFFIALLLFCFSISNTATRVFVSIMSLLVAILIIWCIRMAWESTEGEEDVWQESLITLRRARSSLFKGMMEMNPFPIHRVPRHISQDHITLTDRRGAV